MQFLRILHLRNFPPSILKANHAAHILRDTGFATPAWDPFPTSGPAGPHPTKQDNTTGGNASQAQQPTAMRPPRFFPT